MGREEGDQQRRGQGKVLEARSSVMKAQVACLKVSKPESGPALVKDRTIGHTELLQKAEVAACPVSVRRTEGVTTGVSALFYRLMPARTSGWCRPCPWAHISQPPFVVPSLNHEHVTILTLSRR